MEHKYMNNPQILNFLSQYDKSEWDAILEDLIIYSINKIKEIEKEEESQKKIEIPKKPNYNGSGIISFNNINCGPYEYATTYLKQNAEFKSDTSFNNNRKLDELNKKINTIHTRDKNKLSKKKK